MHSATPLSTFNLKLGILFLILSLCIRCFGTTLVVISNSDRIVAGIDRRTTVVDSDGRDANHDVTTKIALLNERFIVACVGLEVLRYNGQLIYKFVNWISTLEPEISPTASVFDVADIVARESKNRFTQPVTALAIRNFPEKDASNAPTFFVAGFDHGKAVLLEIDYRLNWEKHSFDEPIRRDPIIDGADKTGVHVGGMKSAISQVFDDPNSDPYKRAQILAPTALKTLLGGTAIADEETDVQFVRALISIEAEVDSRVGNGSDVVVLPSVRAGKVTEYPANLLPPKP